MSQAPPVALGQRFVEGSGRGFDPGVTVPATGPGVHFAVSHRLGPTGSGGPR